MQGILINGQFPGPDIHCVTNDNIIVNVFNSLDEPFLLSWSSPSPFCLFLKYFFALALQSLAYIHTNEHATTNQNPRSCYVLNPNSKCAKIEVKSQWDISSSIHHITTLCVFTTFIGLHSFTLSRLKPSSTHLKSRWNRPTDRS